jgi:hypothetical protein
MYWRLPAKSAKPSVLGPRTLRKPGRTAAMLYVGAAVQGGRGDVEGIQSSEKSDEFGSDVPRKSFLAVEPRERDSGTEPFLHLLG